MPVDIRRPVHPASWAGLRVLLNTPIDELTFTHKFARYFVVGGTCAVIDYAIFSAMFVLGLHYLLAGTISFLIAVLINYWLSIRFVFRGGRHSRRREIVLVYLVSAVGIAINLGTLTGLVELAQIHPLVAKWGGTAAAFLWNFSSRYLWVFAR